MNKSELVEAIAKETGVSKKDTEATLKPKLPPNYTKVQDGESTPMNS